MQVKRGSTRLVFIFKKFVIKVPNGQEYRLFLHGLLANMQERVFSRMKRPDLAKVKYCDKFGILLIMERAIELDLTETNWLEFSEQLELQYKDDPMEEFMLSDAKPSNWGYIDTQLVKIDYGN